MNKWAVIFCLVGFLFVSSESGASACGHSVSSAGRIRTTSSKVIPIAELSVYGVMDADFLKMANFLEADFVAYVKGKIDEREAQIIMHRFMNERLVRIPLALVGDKYMRVTEGFKLNVSYMYGTFEYKKRLLRALYFIPTSPHAAPRKSIPEILRSICEAYLWLSYARAVNTLLQEKNGKMRTSILITHSFDTEGDECTLQSAFTLAQAVLSRQKEKND